MAVRPRLGTRALIAQGLDRANVDAIAEGASISKMTIYSHFVSNEALFVAVVRDRTYRVVGGFEAIECLDPEFPQQALMTVGNCGSSARFTARVPLCRETAS